MIKTYTAFSQIYLNNTGATPGAMTATSFTLPSWNITAWDGLGQVQANMISFQQFNTPSAFTVPNPNRIILKKINVILDVFETPVLAVQSRFYFKGSGSGTSIPGIQIPITGFNYDINVNHFMNPGGNVTATYVWAIYIDTVYCDVEKLLYKKSSSLSAASTPYVYVKVSVTVETLT